MTISYIPWSRQQCQHSRRSEIVRISLHPTTLILLTKLKLLLAVMHNSDGTPRQTFIYPVGDTYTGTWDDEGRKHGIGKLYLTNGSFYVGQFQHGLCSGLGVLKLPDGAKYEGEFINGKFHGVGVYTRTDGMKFEGEFFEGDVRGLGLLTFPDGTHGIPRNEGRFEGTKFLGHVKSVDVVIKAREASVKAYTCTDP